MLYIKNELIKWADFLHADTNLGKLKFVLIIIRWALSKMGEILQIVGFLNQVYLSNDLMNRADWLNDSCMLIVMEWCFVWRPVCSVSLTYKCVGTTAWIFQEKFPLGKNNKIWSKMSQATLSLEFLETNFSKIVLVPLFC